MIKNKLEIIKPAIVLFVFAVIYSLISLPNHYYFRTFAQDLGIFNNALYDYAHLQWNKPTILHFELSNTLGDHFILIAFLVAPFTYIFGSYTLLIFQILAILFGGLGIYKIVRNYFDGDVATVAMAHFFSLWGIYSALSYDAHYNVIGTMFLPWFIYFFIVERSVKKGLIFFFLMLFTKENFSIWLIFILMSLFFIDRRPLKDKIKLYSVLIAICVVYFIVVVIYIMPSFSVENRYAHFDFSVLGNNFGEVVITAITRPLYTVEMFFSNFSGKPEMEYLKYETLLFFFVSGGIFFFRKPYLFLMVISVFGQKFFNNYYNKWGLFIHHSIEFVPVIAFGVYYVMKVLNFTKKKAIYTGLAFSIVSFVLSMLMIHNSKSIRYRTENYAFFESVHYNRQYDISKVYDAMDLIPDTAVVSALSPIVPHLALRDKIYEFPVIRDASYIIVIPDKENTFPLTKETFRQKLDSLYSSKNWKVIMKDSNVVLIKKIR